MSGRGDTGDERRDRDGEDGQPGEEEQSGRGRGGAGEERDRSVAERITLAISVAIVALLVALVGYEYLAGGAEPPAIEVQPRPQAIRRDGDHHYLPVEIANRGDRTAEDVHVRLTLTSGEGRRESAEFLIPFLAGGATREATVVFRDDPAQGELTVDTVSFVEP